MWQGFCDMGRQYAASYPEICLPWENCETGTFRLYCKNSQYSMQSIYSRDINYVVSLSAMDENIRIFLLIGRFLSASIRIRAEVILKSRSLLSKDVSFGLQISAYIELSIPITDTCWGMRTFMSTSARTPLVASRSTE